MRFIGALLTVCAFAAAQPPQAPNPDRQSAVNGVRMVERTTRAIAYNRRSESTRIDFHGTSLLPEARGEATVEGKQGVIGIQAHMQGLWPATKFGPEYLTYVMWTITPEGGATNVGELLLDRGKTKLDVTTELPSFGLIVTAEPYFAVTRPSDFVVMESFVRKDMAGTVEVTEAKYDLLPRGQYTWHVDPAQVEPPRRSSKVPWDLYEARNAVRIARWAGAEKYAPDTFRKAVQDLENAEGYLTGKAGTKPIGTVAREAVQMAEDARIVTVRKIDEERLASKRQAGVGAEARAESHRNETQANAALVTENADTAQLVAQSEADRVKGDNGPRITADRNQTDRLKSESATMAAAKAEAVRLKRDSDRQPAAAGVAPVLGTAQTEADLLKVENDAQRAGAEADLDRGIRRNPQAEPEKAELRARLLAQFAAILETRDTTRGLIVDMSDVLFDTDQYSLRPLAREKLAKVAGIVSSHPGLRLDVEGYTDSVGGDEDNQRLSEQRGASVRDYLIRQGMPVGSVTIRGFGKAEPVASNDTAQGRQRNRWVELVVSGDIIGLEIGTPIAAR
jgi:outer membrane protein OmpA-like peptidoglycan-associated protein